MVVSAKRNALGIAAVAAGLVLAGAGFMTLSSPRPAVAETGSFLRDGKAGFVVTHFAYALGKDPRESGACPNGMSMNVAEIFAETPEGQRRPSEGDGEYGKRLEAGGQRLSASPDGKNYCMHPELAPPDTHFRTLDSLNIEADGIDLDGANTRSPRQRADFAGVRGGKGVDNQFFRTIGCTRSFQSDGQSNGFEIEMYTGSWGILIQLDDVDSLVNDDDVKVGVYANADPIMLSPTRVALEYATYAMDQDPRFRATTIGRIRNGVLTTAPFDMRVRNVVNGMMLERPLDKARIQATLSRDGVLKGYMAGYTPIKEMYDLQFGYRNGKNPDGTPAPQGRILGSANGAARVLGHTCPGAWQALNRLADGERDPRSGKFRAISTQYTFEARPAFLVDVETHGANDKLVRND